MLLRRKAMTNPESILKNRESSVQSLSHVWFFAISWTIAHEAPLSITKSQCLLKLVSISLVMPSKHLILCCSFSSCFQFFQASRTFPMSQFFTRWPKYWSFSFSISPSSEYSGLMSFRVDWFDLLAVQGILKSLLQHHNSKASILRCSSYFFLKSINSSVISKNPLEEIK